MQGNNNDAFSRTGCVHASYEYLTARVQFAILPITNVGSNVCLPSVVRHRADLSKVNIGFYQC